MIGDRNGAGLPAWLPWPLREPRSALASIGVGWLFTFLPSLALGLLVHVLLPDIAQPEIKEKGALILFMLVVFAPLFETLIMAGVLALLLRWVRPVPAILMSSIGWGVAHSSQALGWGLVIWWPFLIFSTLYVAWRSRGFWIAVAIVASTHALHNLLPSLLFTLSG